LNDSNSEQQEEFSNLLNHRSVVNNF